MVTSEEIRDAKDALRTALRSRRATRTAAERAAADAARAERVLAFLGAGGPGFGGWGAGGRGAGDLGHLTVASYLSVPPEPDTTQIIAALHVAGARVLLPVLTGRRRDQPDWAAYRGADALRPGRWGIAEPASPALGAAAIAGADVVLVSALAVTPAGTRLGVGGGWFDRALTHAGPRCVTVALVSADEVLDSLPREPWDRAVDVIATETGVRRAGSRSTGPHDAPHPGTR